MQNINWQEIAATSLTAFIFIKRWATNIYQIILPIVIELDQMAIGTKIDKTERKKLAMEQISLAEQKGEIKLGIIGRFVLSHAVDFIAGKLPDLTQTAQTKADLDELVGKSS